MRERTATNEDCMILIAETMTYLPMPPKKAERWGVGRYVTKDNFTVHQLWEFSALFNKAWVCGGVCSDRQRAVPVMQVKPSPEARDLFFHQWIQTPSLPACL